MFGIDFPELVVIAVVALIVIGPEHLPKVARTVGHLWGRAQRYVNGVKADISRDLALEELRKFQQTAQQEAVNIGHSMSQSTQEVEKQVSDIATEVTASKYELGSSIPANEIANTILPTNELLKSEQAKSNVPRHEIIEEHHAVLPASSEQKHPTNT